MKYFVEEDQSTHGDTLVIQDEDSEVWARSAGHTDQDIEFFHRMVGMLNQEPPASDELRAFVERVIAVCDPITPEGITTNQQWAELDALIESARALVRGAK